uniref:Uncharacterized protein n=1 Tax=Aegilops tauschii subsp. strangulata TaxID=200361 RepID=A0A453LF43_AEGTS
SHPPASSPHRRRNAPDPLSLAGRIPSPPRLPLCSPTSPYSTPTSPAPTGAAPHPTPTFSPLDGRIPSPPPLPLRCPNLASSPTHRRWRRGGQIRTTTPATASRRSDPHHHSGDGVGERRCRGTRTSLCRVNVDGHQIDRQRHLPHDSPVSSAT